MEEEKPEEDALDFREGDGAQNTAKIENNMLFVPDNGRYRSIVIDDIFYFEAPKSYRRIFTTNGNYQTSNNYG